MTLNHILQEIAPTVQTVSTVAVTAVAAQAVAVLRKVGRKQMLDTVKHLAETYVRQVEQQCAKTLDNPSKKEMVRQKLHHAFPWLPDPLLDAAIEAAVHDLPKQDGVPVPLVTQEGGA